MVIECGMAGWRKSLTHQIAHDAAIKSRDHHTEHCPQDQETCMEEQEEGLLPGSGRDRHPYDCSKHGPKSFVDSESFAWAQGWK